jgi:biotin carboxyl carrier protein
VARSHRRPRDVRPLLPIVAGVVAVAIAVVAASSAGARHATHAGIGSGSRGLGPGAHASTPRSEPFAAAADPRLVAFASWRGLELYLPSSAVRCVCYHEASYHDAMALHPLGRLRHDYNVTKFSRREPVTPGPDYIVMSSRGRPTPATSAADVVMPRGTKVRAPVSGVVTKVKRYRLYGGYVDDEVEIRPDDAPDVRLAMIHLDDLEVHEGDEVSQGASVIGVPRIFPFSSQTDLYIPGGNPHVHMEVIDPSRAR